MAQGEKSKADSDLGPGEVVGRLQGSPVANQSLIPSKGAHSASILADLGDFRSSFGMLRMIEIMVLRL